MNAIEKYCSEHGLDINKVLSVTVGQGGSVLPQKSGFTGYMAEITDTSIIFTNDKLGVKKEVPFSTFRAAEFGIGNGVLWLQCMVNDSPFVFGNMRKAWKSPASKLLLEKISAEIQIEDMKAYDQYTGKLFFLYMFK